jgi:hypothetical protein
MSRISLEQYVGSTIAYILAHAETGTTPYYGKVPEDFKVPSVFFPVPWTDISKALLGSVFTKTVHFECVFLAGDSWTANACAEQVRDAMVHDRCVIPCLTEDGKETGYGFYISTPKLQETDTGSVSMQFSFDHTQEDIVDAGPKISNVSMTQSGKE